MSTASGADPTLFTAGGFACRPDPGHPDELVRGRIVPLPRPDRRHGQICGNVILRLGHFLEVHDLGHVCNGTGVITERGPDTVRGADAAFYNYRQVPKRPLPDDYGEQAPELVVMVRSPSDRWPKILTKVAEFLNAGVLAVVVLDDDSQTALLCLADQAPRRRGPDDVLEVPEILPGFAVPVRRFFE
jgi:Uma2 family endonuclease